MALASFTVKRTYCKLTVSLHVDCEARESSLSVSYDRRLIRVHHPVPYALTSTPEAAATWLCQPAGERGSLLETLESDCRRGILAAQETG